MTTGEELPPGGTSTFDRTMKLGPLRLTPDGQFRVAGWPETAAEWDPPRLDEGRSVAETFAVPGAVVSHFALVSPGLDVQGLTISATVTAPDTVTVVLGNNTGKAVDLGPSTWKVRVLK